MFTPTSAHRKTTSFASTPRNLQKIGYMEEYSLMRMELVEARKIEELREQQAANARSTPQTRAVAHVTFLISCRYATALSPSHHLRAHARARTQGGAYTTCSCVAGSRSSSTTVT